MRKYGARSLVFVIFLFVFLNFVKTVAAQETNFLAFCSDQYTKTSSCPANICQLKKECKKDDESEICQEACVPQKCPDIQAQFCPQDYCAEMENCSGKKICHYKMQGGQPACGGLAYAGQDVACCSGFVRRCGVEFLDGSCDMKGENSVYSLPICIPCGDGVCSQFEDRCNCPEDCTKTLQREEVPDKFKEILRQRQEQSQQPQAQPKAPPAAKVVEPQNDKKKKSFTW